MRRCLSWGMEIQTTLSGKSGEAEENKEEKETKNEREKPLQYHRSIHLLSFLTVKFVPDFAGFW